MEMPEQRKYAFWSHHIHLLYGGDLVDLVRIGSVSWRYLVLQVTWPCAMKSIIDYIHSLNYTLNYTKNILGANEVYRMLYGYTVVWPN